MIPLKTHHFQRCLNLGSTNFRHIGKTGHLVPIILSNYYDGHVTLHCQKLLISRTSLINKKDKMIKKFQILIVLLITFQGFSQLSFRNPDEANVVSLQTKEIDVAQIRTEGSPYLNEEFIPGKVLVNGNVKMKGRLRYNAYNSEIELEKNKYEYTSVLKRGYISAIIGNKKYKLYSYLNAAVGNIKTGYFNPLNEGEVQLLYKPEIKVRRGRTPSTSYDRKVAPRFIDVSSYYIKKGENAAEKIYLRKKYLHKALNGDSKIKQYVKANGLKLNNEEDIVKLLNFYNQQFTENAK